MKKIIMYLCLIVFTAMLIQAQNKKEEMLLEAIGALSGQNMYLTYMSLGNIADSYASGLYKLEFATQIADELNEMIIMTIQKYKDMLASKLIVGDDYNDLMKFVDVYSALNEQASGLKSMITQNNEENIGKFERGRQKAWKKISDMLGIKE